MAVSKGIQQFLAEKATEGPMRRRRGREARAPRGEAGAGAWSEQRGGGRPERLSRSRSPQGGNEREEIAALGFVLCSVRDRRPGEDRNRKKVTKVRDDVQAGGAWPSPEPRGHAGVRAGDRDGVHSLGAWGRLAWHNPRSQLR